MREEGVDIQSSEQNPDARYGAVDDQLAIINGLWDEPDGWSFEGEHYQVRNAIFRPRGPRPNVIVGGVGRPRSCRLGAQYANEYNISSSNPAEVREINARLDAACEKLYDELRAAGIDVIYDDREQGAGAKFATADLGRAIPLLEELGQEAVGMLPNLLEPWQVISETGEMGQQTDLTLIAKARFGKAGEMRPRL